VARREESGGPYEEHPLFPLEEGGKPFEVAFISMARKDGGAMVWIPQIFPANELTRVEQILERFGGGTYELWARGASTMHVGQPGNITKKRMLTIPGRPKPLDPSNATVQEEIAAGIRPNPLDAKPASSGVMGGDSGVLVAILQMNQAAAERAQQQSMQFMTMFMQMMQSSKAESAQMMQTMMTAMTQMTTSQQQSMMQVLPLLITSKGGGPEEISKYLELFKSMGFAKTEAAPPTGTEEESELNVGEVLSNVATIMQSAPAAISALKEMAPGPPGNGQVTLPAAPPASVPPGSAASVLGK
jgi:hypothetical protein